MHRRAWPLLHATILGYIEDEAMSRGAAIAYYSFFSVAPLLVIAIAIAGMVFGAQAAEGAVAKELEGLMGATGAQVVQGLVRSVADYDAGRLATILSVGVLLVSASSVFTEVQSALNVIWRAPPPERGTVLHWARNKALSVAFVLGSGFFLLASLLATAVLSAITSWAAALVPLSGDFLGLTSFGLSFVLTTLLFALIYKALPNRDLHWSDVGVGALMTALLFTAGKWLIGWYIGTTGIASIYGAAGSLMVVLLWIYYSAQIFLLGAEFTRAWVGRHTLVPVEVLEG
jgi:membrane protein